MSVGESMLKSNSIFIIYINIIHISYVCGRIAFWLIRQNYKDTPIKHSVYYFNKVIVKLSSKFVRVKPFHFLVATYYTMIPLL